MDRRYAEAQDYAAYKDSCKFSVHTFSPKPPLTPRTFVPHRDSRYATHALTVTACTDEIAFACLRILSFGTMLRMLDFICGRGPSLDSARLGIVGLGGRPIRMLTETSFCLSHTAANRSRDQLPGFCFTSSMT